jgi:hypothetical protein
MPWSDVLLRTLRIPADAGPGDPVVIIDGDTGTIIVQGANPDDKIIITPDGPNNTPQINIQSTNNPGDAIAGLEYFSSFGLRLIAGEYVDTFDGDIVRQRVQLDEGGTEVGAQITASGLPDGGQLAAMDDVARLAWYRAGTLAQSIVLDWVDGIVIAAGLAAGAADTLDLSGNVTIGRAGLAAMQEHSDIEAGSVAVPAPATAYSNGGADVGFSFVAPPSGQVEITVGGGIGSSGAVVGRLAYHSFEVRNGNTLGAGAVFLAAADTRSKKQWVDNAGAGFKYSFGQESFTVTGLTAGSDYNVRCMGRANNVADAWAHFDWFIRCRPILLVGS